MHFDIFTLFPGMFDGVFSDSILKRAITGGVISVSLHHIRDYADGRHKVTDDTPYGGGGGMVMKPEPIFRAVESVLARGGIAEDAGPAGAMAKRREDESVAIILLTPQGRRLTQAVAEELAVHDRIMLICGRYEGVDERVRTMLATDEISIGDFVISGGELAAAVIVDVVTRLLPGALGCDAGAYEDSFATGLLEYPQYTRPAAFRGAEIPNILTSGDHAKVARWRREQALRRTWERRPDLLRSAPLSEMDRRFIEALEAEEQAPADPGGSEKEDPPSHLG
jgi:tRNA (guanine37-N1)-methyltransferase